MSVVLPDPLGPMMLTFSPASAVIETSSRIVAPPADTVMFAHPMATGAFVIACSPFARREAKPQ